MIAAEITRTQQQAKEDAETITNWYKLRRQQALLEIENLEIAYNERMAEHSAEWSLKLHQLYDEPFIEEGGIYCLKGDVSKGLRGGYRTIPLMPKLTRSTNLRSLPEYAPLWKLPDKDNDDDFTFPRLERGQSILRLCNSDDCVSVSKNLIAEGFSGRPSSDEDEDEDEDEDDIGNGTWKDIGDLV